MFVHLHTHSSYSFLRGLPSPDQLATAAAREAMPALALTDHISLTGAVEFYDACHAAGVQPILGLELPISPSPSLLVSWSPRLSLSLILLARDLAGWSALCRLSSRLLTAIEPLDNLPFEDLAAEASGLICLTGGLRGLVTVLLRSGHRRAAESWLGALNDVFPGRLYLQLQPHIEPPLEDRLVALAHQLQIPLVAANDVHYLSEADAALQRLVTAIRLNLPLAALPASDLAPPRAAFTTAAEMAGRYAHLPAALASTLEIAGRCRLELPLGKPHYPRIPLPAGLTPEALLRQEAEAGARKHYGGLTSEIRARLDRELSVIEAYGYAALFLIMQEIVDFARQKGIPISSRGSAASSLVAHCLGITSPDPLRLNLYFERFLNPARATPPDIDTDLCSRRRDEVIDHVYETYGQDRVAMVSTINRFRRRSALREAAKAHGLSSGKITALADALPHRWYGPPSSSSTQDGPYAALRERFSSAQYEPIFRDAAALIGLPRHLSIHPGGVVITPGPLTDLVPALRASKGMIAAQFDLESIERLGLVKIDLLGIRGLSVLGDVARAVPLRPALDASPQPPETARRLDPKSPSLALLEAVPDRDGQTAALVREGRTIGCFQIESPGMRATLREIQAGSVDDIMVALALYRPGPLTGGLKDAFVLRHRGEEAPSHLHPALEPLLNDTHGVILYQEQVLRIAHELSGLSLADADLLRRAMSHFDPGERMKTLQEKFIAGAYARSAVPESVAGRIWDLMAAFAGYGFPKAHAASYAQVAWRAAWCKAHFPAIFMAAVLANWGGYYSQRVYLNEARRSGLTTRPPHINHSQREFTVLYPQGEPVLYMGLDQVRDLTRRTQARILRHRPFASLDDFLARVDPRPVEAENLVSVSALDGLGTIPALLQQLENGVGWRKDQLPLFAADQWVSDDNHEDWTLEQKVDHEEAILGAGVTAHRLDLVAGKVAAAGAISTLDAAGKTDQRVRIAGTRQSWRRAGSARGEAVYFMSLEDLDGSINVFITSEVHKRHQHVFSSLRPFLVEGILEMNQAAGEPSLRAEKAWRL